MLKIIHFPDLLAWNSFTSKVTYREIGESHLISYSDEDKVVITKSRWLTGVEYPCEKDHSGYYIVSKEVYQQILLDTHDKYIDSWNEWKINLDKS